MDLLFKRYASPFSLLEMFISTGRFSDFVNEFIEIQNEESEWEFYIHRVFDKSFDEFKSSISSRRNNMIPTDEPLETTLQNSKSLLNNFIPS